jgi:hypothetical protein
MYHEIMKHEFKDRGGCDPIKGHTAKAKCEREHDWVLLLFARSNSLQKAASEIADLLETESQKCSTPAESLIRLRWLQATLLSGSGNVDSHSLGYLTVAGALEMLAIGVER